MTPFRIRYCNSFFYLIQIKCTCTLEHHSYTQMMGWKYSLIPRYLGMYLITTCVVIILVCLACLYVVIVTGEAYLRSEEEEPGAGEVQVCS